MSFLSWRIDIKMVCSRYAYKGALLGPGGLTTPTVCEVLADPTAYDGKGVALMGRLDDPAFGGSWLSQDRCGSALITDGHKWP